MTEVRLRAGVYPLQIHSGKAKFYNVRATPNGKNKVYEWHRKLSHLSPERYNHLSELNNDIPKFNRNPLVNHHCVPCLVGKAKRAPIHRSTRTISRPLELIHLDISGVVEKSLESYAYALMILNDFTAKSDVKILKRKPELANALMNYKVRSEVIHQKYGIKLTNIRLDRPGENFPNIIKEFCRENGICLEPSHAYAPQSNGAAEQLIQKHWIRARVLLISPNMPNFFVA